MCIDEVAEKLLEKRLISVSLNENSNYKLELIGPKDDYWNKAMELRIYHNNELIGTMGFSPFGRATFPEFQLGDAIKAGAYFSQAETKEEYEVKGPCSIKREFVENISSIFFELGLRVSKKIIDEQPSGKLEKTYWMNILHDDKQLEFYKQFGEVQIKGSIIYLQMSNLNRSYNIKPY